MYTEPTCPLTDDQIEHYYREGYLIVEGLAPNDAIESVVAEGAQDPCIAGRRLDSQHLRPSETSCKSCFTSASNRAARSWRRGTGF